MREVDVGALLITKNCTLLGGAVGLKYNKEQMEALKSLVNKIP